MSNIIGADTAKLAGLQVDLLQKIRNGSISLEMFEKFVRGELVVTGGNKVWPFNINLSWAYQLCGLEAEYKEASKEFDFTEDSSNWKLLMVKGLTSEMIVKVFREKLDVIVYCYQEDLDSDMSKNDRDPRNGSYAIVVKAVPEADEENKNKSANMLTEEGHHGMTLTERLFLELVYFLSTGKHLDEENWTLCAGSRGSGGFVPSVCWSRDCRELDVHWCSAADRDGFLRSRSVSVLPTEAQRA